MSLSSRPSPTRTEEYPIADEPNTVDATSISDWLNGVIRVRKCQKNSKIRGPLTQSNSRNIQRAMILARDATADQMSIATVGLLLLDIEDRDFPSPK